MIGTHIVCFIEETVLISFKSLTIEIINKAKIINSKSVMIYILFSKNGIEVIKHILNHKTNNITVVIDAGHGGFDPGKIGINNALEKDINLNVAYKLKRLLEQNDIQAILTRKDDNGLYEKFDQNKKPP